MKLVDPLVLAAALLTGCAATQPLDTQRDLAHASRRLADRPMAIHLMDSSVHHGTHLQLGRDSTFWVEQGSKRLRGAATTDVHAVEAAAFPTPPLSSKRFAVGFTMGYTAAALTQLRHEAPGRISAGQFLFNLGAGLVAGMIGDAVFGDAREEPRAIGRYIVNPR